MMPDEQQRTVCRGLSVCRPEKGARLSGNQCLSQKTLLLKSFLQALFTLATGSRPQEARVLD